MIISTCDLERHINNLNERLRKIAEKDQIFREVEVYFAKMTPCGISGDFCYSNGEKYVLGNVGDRGELSMSETDSLFEISYWVLKRHTFVMAFDYEHKHRNKGQDTRRIAFRKQVELMASIGEDFMGKLKEELDEILKGNPFQDGLNN